ncbi:hypothetical protein BGZ60DRAFT_174564 [Tricladium varicosporioides]|nr:hypothetical protein BGZ60DRAFT_174564 [Hymenoscyphus varicosporioides]
MSASEESFSNYTPVASARCTRQAVPVWTTLAIPRTPSNNDRDATRPLTSPVAAPLEQLGQYPMPGCEIMRICFVVASQGQTPNSEASPPSSACSSMASRHRHSKQGSKATPQTISFLVAYHTTPFASQPTTLLHTHITASSSSQAPSFSP